MTSPKVGKIPPFELIPMLYTKFGRSAFKRANVKKVLGEMAYVSVLRALKDGWLRKVRKIDGVYEYMLSEKAMYLVERTTTKASC